MNLEDFMLGEISQLQDEYCIVPLLRTDRQKESGMGAARGWGWGATLSRGQTFCLGRWKGSGGGWW